MNDFIHGPQLSHPPDGPGALLSQDKPLNHGMNDAVSGINLKGCILSCAVNIKNMFMGSSIQIYNLFAS